jgi:hypothetical protein
MLQEADPIAGIGFGVCSESNIFIALLQEQKPVVTLTNAYIILERWGHT